MYDFQKLLQASHRYTTLSIIYNSCNEVNNRFEPLYFGDELLNIVSSIHYVIETDQLAYSFEHSSNLAWYRPNDYQNLLGLCMPEKIR